MSIDSDSSVVRRKEILSAEVGGEVVIMSVEKGAYFGLDSVGARIWSLLDRPSSVDALCRDLVEDFEVSFEECRTDVIRLLEEMEQQGLVQVLNEEKT